MQLVTWLAAVGREADKRQARAAKQSMPLSAGPPVACWWADAGGGRELRDERAVRAFLQGWPWPVSRCLGGPAGRTGPVHADRFGRRGGLALAPCPLMGRSGRLEGTGSCGPGGEDRGLARTTYALVGGPAGPTGSVHTERYARRGGQGSLSRSLLPQDCGGGLVLRP